MLDNLKLLFIWAPVMNVQLILDGIFIGAVFALTAYGLALVWGVMNIKNLAQGDFVIMGGSISFALFNAGFHPLLTLPLAMILMFGFGWLVYVIIIRRVIDKDMFTSLLATFGLSLLMQQVINLIFGPEVQTVDPDFKIYSAFDDFVTIPSIKILSLVLAALLALGVGLFMKKIKTWPIDPSNRSRSESSQGYGDQHRSGLCHHIRVECCHLWCCRSFGCHDLGHPAFLRHRLQHQVFCYCDRLRIRKSSSRHWCRFWFGPCGTIHRNCFWCRISGCISSGVTTPGFDVEANKTSTKT